MTDEPATALQLFLIAVAPLALVVLGTVALRILGMIIWDAITSIRRSLRRPASGEVDENHETHRGDLK